jgi:hypothetical protein
MYKNKNVGIQKEILSDLGFLSVETLTPGVNADYIPIRCWICFIFSDIGMPFLDEQDEV